MIKLLTLLFGTAKFSKALITVGTMALSIGVYALLFGWQFAVGFVLLIFIHEMGHFAAARQRGLNVGLPTFIPFVGAWIELKDQPMNAETEAYVGFAGPFVGTLGALVCYIVGREFDSRLFLALAYSGLFLNLFNLIPLSPFDGGRITAVLSPRIWIVGVPLLIGLFIWRPNPLLVLMAILAAPQVLKAIHYKPTAPEDAAYYQASAATKLEYAVLYIGLAAFLAVMTYDVKQMLGPA